MGEPILTRNGDTLELDLSKCRGADFQDALTRIRDVPGRRFDYDRKLWCVPAEPSVAERVLKTIRPEADQSLLDWVTESRTAETAELTTPLPNDATLKLPWAAERQPWQPEKVNDEPFNGLLPYQRALVARAARHQRLIIADDMGLGKTIQAIATVEEYCLTPNPDGTDREGPKLVVAPNSVKGGWARELDRWLEVPNFQIIDAASPAKRKSQLEAAIAADAWAIVNWEQLRVKREQQIIKRRNGAVSKKMVEVMKEPLFEETPWLAVIADEVHRAKNRKAAQTKGLWRVQAPVMLALSGTPLMNDPSELWAILHWLFPKEYTSYWRFYEQYVDYYEDHFNHKIITGVKNPDALRFELKNRLARRTAAILGLKGRKRIYYDVPLNPGQRKLYDAAEKEMWLKVQKEAEDGDKSAAEFVAKASEGATPATLYRIPNGAARMVRLQQIIESPALLGGDDDSAILDDLEEKVEDSRPEPWVVFVKFKETCSLVAARLEAKGLKVGVYNGDVDAKTRTELENRFQRGEVDVVVGTIAAMKEGITLTRGNKQFWASRDFVPANNEQGEARNDRLGQQELVFVYIPQAPNTVATTSVAPTNARKERIVKTVVQKDAIQEENA